jgi:hypothetical protein
VVTGTLRRPTIGFAHDGKLRTGKSAIEAEEQGVGRAAVAVETFIAGLGQGTASWDSLVPRSLRLKAKGPTNIVWNTIRGLGTYAKKTRLIPGKLGGRSCKPPTFIKIVLARPERAQA